MLLGGRRVSGVQTVLEVLHLEERAKAVDLLVSVNQRVLAEVDRTRASGPSCSRISRAASSADSTTNR